MKALRVTIFAVAGIFLVDNTAFAARGGGGDHTEHSQPAQHAAAPARVQTTPFRSAPAPASQQPRSQTPSLLTTPFRTSVNPSTATRGNQGESTPALRRRPTTPPTNRGYGYPGYSNNRYYGYGYPWWLQNNGYQNQDGTDYTDDSNNDNNNNAQNNAGLFPAPPAAGFGGVPFAPAPIGPFVPPVPAGPSPIAIAAQAFNAMNKDPDWIAANNAVTDAQLDYDRARQRVMDALQNNPDFKQAVARKRVAGEAMDDARSTGKPESDVIAAASAKMDAGGELTRMIEQAVVADAAASDAKTRLEKAATDRDALRVRLLGR